MKTTIFIISLIFVSLVTKAQRKPIMKYGEHTKEELTTLIFGKSAESIEVYNFFFNALKDGLADTLKVTKENLPTFCNFLFSEEVQLKAGKYMNSGLNLKTQKLEFFPGSDFDGFVWVVRIGSYRIVLFKQNCLNPLKVANKHLTNNNIHNNNNNNKQPKKQNNPQKFSKGLNGHFGNSVEFITRMRFSNGLNGHYGC